MIRLITVGDQHGDVTGPLRRTDDYLETWFAKMEEVRDLAIQRSADAVIFTGDLVHRPNGAKVPYSFVNRVIDHFASYPRSIALLAGLGNHDIVGNVESWNRQPIGAIVRAGRLHPLWVESYRYLKTPAVLVTSIGYADDQDLPEHRDRTYGVVRDTANQFVVHVVHTMLLPDSMSLPVSYTTPSLIVRDVAADRRADLYVGGHVHDDLGLFGVDGAACLNFGSLTRGSIAEADLTRQVGVGLVEIDYVNGYTMKVTRLPLTTMRPAAEVFDLQGLSLERKRDERIDRLVEALQQNRLADEFRLVDPHEAAEAVLALQQVPEAVKQRVNALIGRAKENLA